MFRAYVDPGLPESQTRVPIYQLLSLHTQDTGVQGLSVQTSVWGQADFANLEVGKDGLTGDVDVLFASYRAPAETALEGLNLRVGRQLIAAGPTLMDQIDGGYLSYRFYGIELHGFGGMVAGTRFTEQAWPMVAGKDQIGLHWTAGGRIAYTGNRIIAVGASYRQKRYYGQVGFNEVAADLRLHPTEWLELIGEGVIELTDPRPKEVNAAARARLGKNLMIGAGYRFQSPDLFIPRSSIFSVFSDEEHHAPHVDAWWSITQRLSLEAELGVRVFGGACITQDLNGTVCEDPTAQVQARLRGDYRLGHQGRHRLTAMLERAGAPDGGFTRGRLAGRFWLLDRLVLAADFDLYYRDDRGNWIVSNQAESSIDWFETEGSGDSNFSFSASGSARYHIRHDMRVTANGMVQSTPLFSSAAAFMARFEWFFDRPGKPAPVTTAAKAEKPKEKKGKEESDKEEEDGEDEEES